MDFIFMLTRQDRTITDCLAVLDLILPLKLRHIGFKDVGVDKKTLANLAERIRKSGAMKPATMRRVVVLPHPEGPSSVTNSPSPTSRSMLSTAVKAPYFRVSPLSLSRLMDDAPACPHLPR